MREAGGMAHPTWDERERPILEAIAAAEDADEFVDNDALALATGLPRAQVDNALRGLVEAKYITGADATTGAGSYELIEIRLRERGRRATGQWPPTDDLWRYLGE